MPIISAGQRLPAAYLERFEPAENVPYRMSVLSTNAVAVDFHWLDIPSKDVKGTYQCIQGLCCQAFGRRSQSYNVLVYVYRNPSAGSTEGDIFIWNMTPARWKKFSDFALVPGIDLNQYDLTFQSQKRGVGTDWSYSILPDPKFRDYWTPDQREQLKVAVDSFFQMGESSVLGNMMNYNDWASLLYQVGYDVQNQCWPGGQSPMNSGSAFQAIGYAVHAPTLPPPPSGYLPSQAVITNMHQSSASGVVDVNNTVPTPNPQGGVIFQPSAPQAGVAPIGVPLEGVPMARPVEAPHGYTPAVAPLPNPSGSVPVETVVHANIPAMAPPTSTGTVPLGTAPAMPVQPAVPVASALSVMTPQVTPNEVQGVQEITAEELNAMLDG